MWDAPRFFSVLRHHVSRKCNQQQSVSWLGPALQLVQVREHLLRSLPDRRIDDLCRALACFVSICLATAASAACSRHIYTHTLTHCYRWQVRGELQVFQARLITAQTIAHSIYIYIHRKCAECIITICDMSVHLSSIYFWRYFT